MAKCLDVQAWRKATPAEIAQFHKEKVGRREPAGSHLIIRSKLTQVDVYAWLRARFGQPNGIQNLLRSDSSDNLIHWDFVLKADDVNLYIQGRMRDVMVLVSEPMTDPDWNSLILAIKADFARVGPAKSAMQRSFEKFAVFQNKFASIADVCAELHAAITDAPAMAEKAPELVDSTDQYKHDVELVAKRATSLYGNCLKLRLLTPVMAEAYLNMIIITFCRPDIRNDADRYYRFVREKIPERLRLLKVNCVGFDRAVDPDAQVYKDFLRVMNKRNFAIHGNVDPIRERVETVFFEGKRPLFADNGDHIFKLFEHLEEINKPHEVISDYLAVHEFLFEIQDMLAPKFRSFFEQVIDDPYPGYEVKVKRVTKILPNHNAAMIFAGEKYDDELGKL